MPLYTSYSEETQTQIEEFLENTFGWDEDELVAFVERFGEENFKLYFEEYVSTNKQIFLIKSIFLYSKIFT